VFSVAAADGLPSWNEGAAKTAIVDFVERVKDPESEQFVPIGERIAVFDNDGTLWSEKPFYFQFMFAMDRVAELAKANPDILTSDALQAAASGDLGGALAGGKAGLLEIVRLSHSGMDVPTFQAHAREWLDTANHPEKRRPYGELVYQPMLELLAYLRDNGFKTHIVSGGGVDFIRSIAEDAYGIPPYQVLGSMGNARYEFSATGAVVIKETGVFFVDDKAGKPVGIMRHIGMRPIFVGGNSDGDFQMLEWATAGDGPRLGLIVHHTDAAREWAYDSESHSGKLVRGLEEGPSRGWLIVDMKRDWSQVFPK
jgi:hypothetical protein